MESGITDKPHIRSVIVIGGGPAGLMAAEILSGSGLQVDVYDAMPSLGRKFLLAGKGGLNITHAEPFEAFLSRYGARRAEIETLLNGFGPDALRSWIHDLGIDTFVGTSGRVFPVEMKAAPLLRTWLHRLRAAGVRFHVRHRWRGWENVNADGIRNGLRFITPSGEQIVHAEAVVLALGGGSWARLGSDGAWVSLLEQRGVSIATLQPSNCGFDVIWSEHFRTRYAGHYLKSIAVTFASSAETGDLHSADTPYSKRGEFVVTENGVEGGLIYTLSAGLRDEIAAAGVALINLDLAPDWTLQRVIDAVSQPRGSRSFASHLKSRVGIHGVKAGLLREYLAPIDFIDPVRLGMAIKALPLRLVAPRPIDEAISSAGGIRFEVLDKHLMLRALPGVFCAGEMLDWEAPTGGYLLTACFASGRAAGLSALAWLNGVHELKIK